MKLLLGGVFPWAMVRIILLKFLNQEKLKLNLNYPTSISGHDMCLFIVL